MNGVEDGANYDLAVVGAGSAGFSAAITAAEQGARVALIGHGTIGGTCVNVGCVPSKTLIRATESLYQANAGRFDGIRASGNLADWGKVVAQKDALVESLRQSKYLDQLENHQGIDYLDGTAKFCADGLLFRDKPLAAKKTVIATGSRASIPDIPGIDGLPYLTSTSAFELTRLPRSVLFIGGGYIGCEVAQMMARAGVMVTVACRSRLLPHGEPEISDALTGYLRDEGIEVLNGVAYECIVPDECGIALHVNLSDAGRRTLRAECLLLSAGRQPNTDSLELPAASIETKAGGGVVVDKHMRTSRPGVYAAGDVIGKDQFVYMAAYGARIAALNALNGDGLGYDNEAMPAVVFTDPQVATVGLTEAAARSAGHDVVTSLLPLDYVPRALAARDTRGLIKLVAERSTKRLLGAHILAPEGADAIQTAALAIRQRLTYVDLAEMIFPYLTTVEGLKLAAQAFEKDIAKLSCCAG